MPADDLATVIANGQIDGCPMGDDERLWYYIIVATAGHDTTSFALSGGMEQLARDPAQLFVLRDDPTPSISAADEMIRWTSPVRHFMRYAKPTTSVRGVDIPAGGRVLLCTRRPTATRTVFVDPMTFDVRRPDADKLL